MRASAYNSTHIGHFVDNSSTAQLGRLCEVAFSRGVTDLDCIRRLADGAPDADLPFCQDQTNDIVCHAASLSDRLLRAMLDEELLVSRHILHLYRLLQSSAEAAYLAIEGARRRRDRAAEDRAVPQARSSLRYADWRAGEANGRPVPSPPSTP